MNRMVVISVAVLVSISLIFTSTQVGNVRDDGSLVLTADIKKSNNSTTFDSSRQQVIAFENVSLTLNDTSLPTLLSSTSLFIHIGHYKDGLAAWRVEIIEILVLAKNLNATLVEPCISRGYLVSCGSRHEGQQQSSTMVRLSDIVGIDLLQEYYPHIISHQHFSEMIMSRSAREFVFCNHYTFKDPIDRCLYQNMSQPNFNKHQGEIEVIRQAAVSSTHELTLLHIAAWARGGFHDATLDGATLIPKKEVEHLVSTRLRFRREHAQFVDAFLRHALNSTSVGFHVIQWRPELPDVDFMDCAQRLVQLRNDRLSDTTGSASTPTLLLSSIQVSSRFQWHDYTASARGKNDSGALIYLLERGFVKLDYWLPSYFLESVPDLIFLSVWDLVLAQKASKLVTCLGHCRVKRWACAQCHYRGLYSKTMVEMRKSWNKSSIDCW